ncbi:MAG: hypothetical protein LBR43_02745 [Spiroplasmataceae bacterium]|jgi:hypothetical protein|nr:hypothetical protein [Spiroplasmataceae bacterium]
MINVRISDLVLLEKREKERGDRAVRIAKIFYHQEKEFNYNCYLVVHNDNYDSINSNAETILKLVNNEIEK